MRREANYGIATGAYERERDDWRRALDRASAEQWRTVELTAVVEPLLGALVELLQRDGEALAGFERVSLHAPIAARDLAATAAVLAALPLDGDVIFHPDVWRSEPALRAFGTRVVFENMDIGKSFGRSVDDLRAVFAAHPAPASASTSRTCGRTTRRSRSGTTCSTRSTGGCASCTSRASSRTARIARRPKRTSPSTGRCSTAAPACPGSSRRCWSESLYLQVASSTRSQLPCVIFATASSS